MSENLGSQAKISVYPLAGPTAGNSDFAAYYDSVLGGSTHRMWNPYDVVPLAWNHESMGKMAELYAPLTRANPGDRILIDGLRLLVKDKDYAQIDPTRPALPGAVSTAPFGKRIDWLREVAWQHHCGYQCALGINVMTEAPGCPSSTAKYICQQKECPDKLERQPNDRALGAHSDTPRAMRIFRRPAPAGRWSHRLLHQLGRILVVLELALVVLLVGHHVEVAVAGQVEGDHLLLAALLALQRFVDRDADGVRRLSGAGMMPSAFENCTAASKVASCWTARASMSPCSTSALTLGAMPW